MRVIIEYNLDDEEKRFLSSLLENHSIKQIIDIGYPNTKLFIEKNTKLFLAMLQVRLITPIAITLNLRYKLSDEVESILRGNNVISINFF